MKYRSLAAYRDHLKNHTCKKLGTFDVDKPVSGLKVRPTHYAYRAISKLFHAALALRYLHEQGIVHGDLHIGNILIEANERMPASSNSTYRPTSNSRGRPPYMGSSYVPGYSAAATPHNNPYAPAAGASQLQTQQIYIPNDLVGCIIGKGGAKINEIRHMSASQIKIMEPGAVGVGMNGAPAPAGSEGERLVVITGQPANIQMAVQLLYHVSVFRMYARCRY